MGLLLADQIRSMTACPLDVLAEITNSYIYKHGRKSSLNIDNRPDRPIPNSYWIQTGRFAAGEYPGAPDCGSAAAKLRDLIQSGIDHFIDLTEAEEPLEPYDRIAKKEARLMGKEVQWERNPIVDLEPVSV